MLHNFFFGLQYDEVKSTTISILASDSYRTSIYIHPCLHYSTQENQISQHKIPVIVVGDLTFRTLDGRLNLQLPAGLSGGTGEPVFTQACRKRQISYKVELNILRRTMSLLQHTILTSCTNLGSIRQLSLCFSELWLVEWI